MFYGYLFVYCKNIFIIVNVSKILFFIGVLIFSKFFRIVYYSFDDEVYVNLF